MTDVSPTIDVSIVLITFNDAARIPRALASLSGQTLRNLEIIALFEEIRAGDLIWIED